MEFQPDASGEDRYVGRFAPSPSGPLHFGSLIAAVASYLDAHANQGDWLIRIDDLDPPREQAGAAQNIIHTLNGWGLHSDRDIVYQSTRGDLYQQSLSQLLDQQQAYPCACSRKTLRETAKPASDGTFIYPGTCRNGPIGTHSNNQVLAIRLLTQDQIIAYTDQIQGRQQQNIGQHVGDFILRRADQLWAYQLAVVIDDWQQGITHSVRGADLMPSTIRQIYLQQRLGAPTPHYAHLPIALNTQHGKLSKQTFAPAIPEQFDAAMANRVLGFLGQPTVPKDHARKPETFWQQASKRWTIGTIPRRDQIVR